MNDLELLVMAAKAAGIQHVDYENVDYDGCAGLVIVGEHGQHLHGWNPLADDGDALRLALKLSLNIEFDCYPPRSGDLHRKAFRVRAWAFCWVKEEFDDENSKIISVRRCIVRAAAEIGSKMP
jgi:hypothetical protein